MDPGAINLYSNMRSRNLPLATTVITALELHSGAQISGNRVKNMGRMQRLLKQFLMLQIDERVCETYGALSPLLQEKGSPIGDFDEMIASIALCHDRKLITRDDHLSCISGLKILSY